ncbi:MAG: DUF1583 domain-containing protein [Planctomycetaceae bacterium]
MLCAVLKSVGLILVSGVLIVDPVVAQTPDSTGSVDAARHDLLTEAVLSLNDDGLRSRLKGLPQDRQLFELKAWVLPNSSRPNFRLGSHLFGVKLDDLPGIQLVRTAAELKQGESLLQELRALSDLSPAEERCRTALMFLLKAGRPESEEQVIAKDGEAAALLKQFLDQTDAAQLASDQVDWPTLIVLQQVVRMPELAAEAVDLLTPFTSHLTRYFPDVEQDLFFDHLRILEGLRIHCQEFRLPAEHFQQPFRMAGWQQTHWSTAATLADRRPMPHWQFQSDEVRKLAGHEMDYLLYDQPLTDNFQVECDITWGEGIHSALVIGGYAFSIENDGKVLQLSRFRKEQTSIALDEPLTLTGTWIHCRATMQDNYLTVFMNGREVYSEQLSEDHDPWVGIRSWRRSRMSAKNFRITGQPLVRDTISLMHDEQLTGWSPVFEEGFGVGKGYWYPQLSDDGSTELAGYFRPNLAGSHLEKLVRYQRPMREDGSIHYQFYFRKDHRMVYPALDRTCYLLTDQGIRIHTLTNGRWDRTDADPTLAAKLPEAVESAAVLPLIPDAWNDMTLTITGDIVTLLLNGQPILKDSIADRNSRTFGLFHDADQSQAMVRNIRWQGSWSTKLPDADHQVLWGTDGIVAPTAAQAMTTVVDHDFRNGIPAPLFDVQGDKTSIRQLEDGIEVERLGKKGVEGVRLCAQIDGDFDIEARFRALQIVRPPQEQAGIGLAAFFDSDTMDDVTVFRRQQHAGAQKIAAVYHHLNPEGKFRRQQQDVAEEAVSGRLRLSRRGKTITELFAEGDSTEFRTVATYDVDATVMRPEGIRLLTQADQFSFTKVVWQQLTVRAEHVLEQQPNDNQEKLLVEQLDQQRTTLTSEKLDFRDPNILAQIFGLPSVVESDVRKLTSEGVRVQAIGLDQFKRSYLTTQSIPDALLDAEVSLDVHRIDAPDTPDMFAEAAMLVVLDTDDFAYASIILRRKQNQTLEVLAQLYHHTSTGHRVYSPIRSLPVTALKRMRIAVHQDRLLYLFSEQETGPMKYLASVPWPDLPEKPRPLPDRLYLRAESAAAEGMVDVTWKSLTLAGQQDAVAKQAGPASNATPLRQPDSDAPEVQ